MQFVLSCTTDFGVESALSLVPPLSPDGGFHWWSEQGLMDDDDLDSAPMASPRCAFTNCMPVPGSEHIAHGTLRHVTTKLKEFPAWMRGTKAIGKMLCTKLYRDRIIERLLVGPWFAEARAQMSKSFTQMLDHRFMSLMLFLHDLLPLMLLFRHHWNPRVIFTNLPVDPDAPDTQTNRKEQFIDTSAVNTSFRSDFWRNYGIMIYAVGAGPEHFVHFSRSCLCHVVPFEIPKMTGVLDYIQFWRKRQRDFRDIDCVCKGLVAGPLAVGHGEVVVREGYETLGKYLLLDFQDLDVPSRDRILADWETAMHHVIFEMLIKVSMWAQLPLSMCCLAYDNFAVVVKHLKICCHQYDQSTDAAGHMQLTHTVLGAGPNRTAINEFIASDGQILRPTLQLLMYRLKGVRCNEISVESLHRLGSLLQDTAKHHDAAYVSFHLQMPLIFKDAMFSVRELADVCVGVRSDRQVLEQFDLTRHPTVPDFNQALVWQNKTMQSGRSGMQQLVRQVFYRCDLKTMFATFPAFAEDLKRYKATVKASDARSSHCPLKPIMDTTTISDSEATHALTCRYGLYHLRDTITTDQILVMPSSHSSAIVSLHDVVAPSLENETLAEEELDFDAMIHNDSAPSCALRIVNAKPKRRKLMQSPASELRSDHIACVSYNIAFRDKATRAFHVSSKAFGSSQADVELISFDILLSIGPEKMKRFVLKTDLGSDQLFHFSGVALPHECHAEIGWRIVTQLMDANAYPGQHGKWIPPPGFSDANGIVLQNFIVAGLVEVAGTGFRITSFGLVKMQRARSTQNPRHAFVPSSKKPLMDYTQYELIDFLLTNKWTGHRFQPRVAIAPLKLDPETNITGDFYFNKTLEVSRSYLLALAQNRQLASKGITEIKQKQKVSFCEEFVKLLAPGATLPQMTDETWDENLALLDAPDAAETAMLAIMDRPDDSDKSEEGDPDSDPESDVGLRDDGPDDPAEQDNKDTSAVTIEPFHRWGGFTFRAVRTTVKHREEFKWVVRCPHHADAGDAPGTFCSKAMAFRCKRSQEETKMMLRQWCLEGRYKSCRAADKLTGHRWLEPRQLSVLSPAEQEEALAAGLAAPRWIIGSVEDDSSEMGSDHS